MDAVPRCACDANGRLAQVAGSKDLIIEGSLISPLDLVCAVGLLRAAGVDKIFKLEPGSSALVKSQKYPDDACDPGLTPALLHSCCFLCRNNVSSVTTIVELINADESAGRRRDYFMLCIPRKVDKACVCLSANLSIVMLLL